MRNILEAVVIATLLVALALAAAGLTAVGIALIGLLLHRWFDLTQWQGTLIALAASASFALLLYRALRGPAPVYMPEWEEEEEEEEVEEPEPPIVPWRRSRPTPAEPSSAQPEKSQSTTGRSSKTRR